MTAAVVAVQAIPVTLARVMCTAVFALLAGGFLMRAAER
jgi:hypothetical protein